MVGNLGRIAEAQLGGRDSRTDGNYLYGAFGHDFGTRDGRRVMVVALTGRQWTALIDVTGIAEAFQSLESVTGHDVSLRGRALRCARPDRGGAAAVVRAPARSARSARRSPAPACPGGPTRRSASWSRRTRARRRATRCSPTLEQPGIGSYLVPASPLDFTAAGRQPAGRAPQLGEHTEEILADVLGLGEAEIGAAVRRRDGRRRRGGRVIISGSGGVVDAYPDLAFALALVFVLR